MEIARVAEIIGRIADGIEEACIQCLSDNRGVVLQAIMEQLYSGQDSDGAYLSPTYDDDPFFDEPGKWHGRNEDYKSWKRSIPPPFTELMLGLPPRPDAVPNLYIDGTFYSDITALRIDDMLMIHPGADKGPDIVRKYGDNILEMGLTAVEYFNANYMLPAIGAFFRECGYR